MSRINPALIQRLTSTLDVTKFRVYTLIREVSAANHVPRHIGALILAGQHGISQQKYASDEDMATLGQARGNGPHTIHAPTYAPIPAPRALTRKPAKKAAKTKENSVFVVHGRDRKLTDAVYQLLGALGLKPLEWGHAIKAAQGANPFVSDAVQKILEKAQAIVVLLTPDDLVQLKPQFVDPKREKHTEGKPRGQSRPNVIFEAGLAIGAHHAKTLIVQVGDVKPFTDIGGMHILHLSDSAASRNDFAKRLGKLGCKLDQDGDHWLRTGELKPTEQEVKKKVSKKKQRSDADDDVPYQFRMSPRRPR